MSTGDGYPKDASTRMCFHFFAHLRAALGASSFWRTWRPCAHHISADSLFHGLPLTMSSVLKKQPH